MTAATKRGSIQFGAFCVDFGTQRLHKNGTRLKLPRQSFLILEMLLARPGEVVTREELREALWLSDTFVDFDHGLNNAVNRIRMALNDSAETPKYIETLPRLGYRFVGPVKVVENSFPATVVSQSVPPVTVTAVSSDKNGDESRRWWKSKSRLGSVLALALAILGVWYLLEFRLRPRQPAIDSIAVLALQNLSGDPGEEYFADGTTEELITMLAKLTDVRVISRTSSMRMKGEHKSMQEIGRQLGVDAVVEGSVARSPQTIRITAQLIDVRSDRHLWAEEYEGSPGDLVQLQQRVAREIASQVSAKIKPQKETAFRNAKPINPAAHDLYLKARYYSAQGSPESLTKSIELYQQAIGLQPDYAAAHSGLAVSYCSMASGWDDPQVFFPRARDAALKALSLDNSIPEARTVLAWVEHAYDWDTAGAEAEFQTALKLNGYAADTHSMYASFLADIGRYDEGLAEARLAEDLDPLSVRSSLAAERVLMRSRRFEEFLKQAEQSRKLNPNSVLTTVHLCIVYENLGRFEDAIHQIETHPNAADPPESAPIIAKRLRDGLRRDGPEGYWRASLRNLAEYNAGDHVDSAHVHLMLGDNESGLRELELAVRDRDPAIRFNLKNTPWWDPVRNDPHFQELVRKVGYQEGASTGTPSHRQVSLATERGRR